MHDQLIKTQKYHERIITVINCGLFSIACLVTICMMLLVCFDVAADNILGRPIENSVEIVSFYFMVIIVFLPMGSVELDGEHIATDMFVQLLPAFARKILNVCALIISAAFVLLLTYQTTLDALKATQRGEMMMGTTFIHIWPSKWVLPIGFGFLFICLINKAVTAFTNSPNKNTSPSESTAA